MINKLNLVVLCGIFFAGCGQAKYEERLKASTEFYDYMGTVEANLASPIWERVDLGLKMRLPLPFHTPMARPEILTDEDGNTFYGPDPRQPEVLGDELPGIVEAWQASLPGEGGEQIDSRLYLLTNHSRFIQVDGAVVAAPSEFLTDLEMQLGALFNVFVPDGEANRPGDNIRYGLTLPTPGSGPSRYIEPKRYSAIRFVSEEPINGQQIQAMLYTRQAGDIQAAILIIGPKDFSSQFRQRIDLALQTFDVVPRVTTEMNNSTGTSTSGGSSGF